MNGIGQVNLPTSVAPRPAFTTPSREPTVPSRSWWLRYRLACHLLYTTGLVLVAGAPGTWTAHLVPGVTPAVCSLIGFLAYLIFWTAWSRNPELGLLGTIATGSLLLAVLWNYSNAEHWALQGGLAFLLVHSLRWQDEDYPGAPITRRLAAVVWTGNSFFWMNTEAGRWWMPLIPAVVVLVIYCRGLPARGVWRLFTVPVAALLVMLSGPCCGAVEILRTFPVGLLVMFVTFLLLGVAGIAALTREMWHEQ